MFANYYRSNSMLGGCVERGQYKIYIIGHIGRREDGCWIPRRDSVERSRLFTVAKIQTTLIVNRSSKIIIWLRYTERFINRDVKMYLVFRHEMLWQYINAINACVYSTIYVVHNTYYIIFFRYLTIMLLAETPYSHTSRVSTNTRPDRKTNLNAMNITLYMRIIMCIWWMRLVNKQ